LQAMSPRRQNLQKPDRQLPFPVAQGPLVPRETLREAKTTDSEGNAPHVGRVKNLTMGKAPRTGYETDPDLMDWIAVYEDKDQLKNIAGSLIAFGAERFKGAKIIQGLRHLEAIQNHSRKGITTMEATSTAILPFMMDALIDEIRICLFFENYMKAELLLHSAIIHTFRDPVKPTIPIWERKPTKAEQLHDAQKKQPIAIWNLKANGVTTELQRETITMTLMLKPKYQKVIRLPKDVLTLVRFYNNRRNRLHLATEVSFTLDNKTIEGLKLLDAFVDLQSSRLKQD
jgi:hypothetical protein